jgi:Cu+-exporting ATPase
VHVAGVLDKARLESAERELAVQEAFETEEAQEASLRQACFHCGETCRDSTFSRKEKAFCCQGCLVVHDILAESGLGQFYDLSRHPGVRIQRRSQPSKREWAYLDEPELQQKLLDFTDGRLSRVTFEIPGIHCIACVWLLENLFRLNPGIGKSTVNFPRREVALSFAPARISLSEVVALLVSIGYEPRLTLGETERRLPDPGRKRRWLQLGIAGFAFGNIMLFSLPRYLGLDSFSGPLFGKVFGFLSLALALPVVVYSAGDYWRSALLSFRQRVLTLDVPIVLGLAALYAWSAFEIIGGRGEGYLDSLAGLVFFLLCGRVFQQKTYDRMTFDRDYKCFFPLSVTRKSGEAEEVVAISNLREGDRVLLRNGELIPADARLVSGSALIDYSFVTGESVPVSKQPGDHLCAGGHHIGGVIEIETAKEVSQSYLTSLWNHEAFRKQREDTLNTLTNRYSRRFTRIVIGVAVVAAVFWVLRGDTSRGIKAFTSVLIVACPCALALAAPFTLGTAQRWLARRQVFLRNGHVLERMAQVDAIVFDKTGTLTAAGVGAVRFVAGGLTATEERWVHSLCRGSRHPFSVRITETLSKDSAAAREREVEPVVWFLEVAGQGISGTVAGHAMRLGSRQWLKGHGVKLPGLELPEGSVAYLSIDGEFRGAFVLTNTVRPETPKLLGNLAGRHELALLSGDNERERQQFRALFDSEAQLHFNQSPLDKLGFIRGLQKRGKSVMMVGDGLNDAGALKQSDVGVAVVEKVGTFSPASDVILAAERVPQLSEILSLARSSSRIIRLSFGISALYNAVGVSIAACGILSPVICAFLMPVSSLSVVLFACGATRMRANRLGLGQDSPPQNTRHATRATAPALASPISAN